HMAARDQGARDLAELVARRDGPDVDDDGSVAVRLVRLDGADPVEPRAGGRQQFGDAPGALRRRGGTGHQSAPARSTAVTASRPPAISYRSEERRVGKEGRAGGAA